MVFEEPKAPVLVCGFGIVGLTTSLCLLRTGYPVVAVAAHLPGDPLIATYASTAAGAHHLSFAADDDKRQHDLDRKTFDIMWKEEEEEGEASGLMRILQHEFYGSEGERHVAFLESLPDFRVYSPEELPSFARHGVSFTTLTMDTSVYLAKLVHRFNTLGGVIHRATCPSLVSALQLAPTAQAIINCTGLGSLTLGNVEDNNMYPVRGQVVVLKAPWMKEGRTKQVESTGERTYIIPRRSGEVVIGGTRDIDDWTPDPRSETSEDIKQRALSICPELVPAAARVMGREPIPGDLDSAVVREVVGFRPARKGGLRLERGDDLVIGNQKRIPVFHNIGHGGAGWQSSWGCAEEIVHLVKGVLPGTVQN